MENYMDIYNLLLKQDNMFDSNMDFTDPFIAAVKTSVDWYKLKKSTDSLVYSEVERVYYSLMDNKEVISIVLVGSVARGLYNEASDIDFLVITENQESINVKEDYLSPFRNINVVYRSKRQMLLSYKKGKEFFVWAIRYGLLLYDKNFWVQMYGWKLRKINKNEAEKKRTYVYKTVSEIYTSLINGDVAKTSPLIRKVAIQIARIILILNNIIPKSRPELALQIQENCPQFYNLYMMLEDVEGMEKHDAIEYVDRMHEFLNQYVEEYYSQEINEVRN